MPFSQQGTEPLDAVANVRLTASEKARLQEEAALAGLSVSKLARRRLLGRRVVAKADVTLVNELRRLGGLMKHLHNESGGAYSHETSEVLVALRKAIEAMARDR